MLVTLLVLSPPDLGRSNRHALSFAQALLRKGHDIGAVFFYDAGVLTALAGAEAAQDEQDLRAEWSSLAKHHEITLHACVASAARFGVRDGESLQGGFRISGLGELIEASTRSQRFLTFSG